jgi:hypothetical protein
VHLSKLLAKAFDFMQEIEHQLKSGVIHPASLAKMGDAAELSEALNIEYRIITIIAGEGADESLLLIMKDRLGIDAR